MQSLEISILKTITYFDVFSYPLTLNEIIFFLDKSASEKEIAVAIKHLIKTKYVWQHNNFFSVRNEPGLALRRVRGNQLAQQHIKKAISVAKFLSWFPYIKGIAISGSLSKNFADENSDLDFFIITAANRLWVVRILYSLLFKIASIAGIKNWFCLNYFIDESDLKIKEHNIFTAIEAATLMPLKGEAVFKEFFCANDWLYQYLPNYNSNYKYLKDAPPAITKRLAEWMMNFEIGNKLDNKLHAFFKKRFETQTLQNKQSDKGLIIGAYEAGKHCCKPLPQYFQPKILEKFYHRFQIIKDKYSREILDAQDFITQN